MKTKEEIDNLIINNQKLIYLAIKRLGCMFDNDDEFQEYYDAGLDGLIKGASHYDETKAQASTFLYHCIYNELLKCMKRLNYKKNKNQYGKNISLNELVYENDRDEIERIDLVADPKINIVEDFENKLLKEKLFYAINEILDETERRILCSYYGIGNYKKYDYRELMKKENLSHSMINYYVGRAKKKIKKFFDKNKEDAYIMKTKNIEEILEHSINGEFNLTTKQKKILLEHIKELQGELNEAYDNSTWWESRFYAEFKINKGYKDKINKITEYINNHPTNACYYLLDILDSK